MSGEAHEVYKELSTAINEISKDLVTGLVALRAVSGDNKADIQRVERRFEKGIESLREKVEALRRSDAATGKDIESVTSRIAKLEKQMADAKESDKAIQVENTKGRWAFWVAVVGGSAGVLTALGNIIAKALGWAD